MPRPTTRVRRWAALAAAVPAVLAGTGPAAAAGMPQLDADHFPTQVIWLAISFVVLYLLTSRLALPRIGQVLEERQRRIDDNLRKAETLKAKADEAAEDYERALAEARSEAQEVLRRTTERLSDEAARHHSELLERLTGEVAAAEERIAKAKDDALAGVRDMAGDLAVSVVDKLAGEKTDRKSAAAAVGAALKERR